jgi:hypothetical protein
MSAVDYPSPQVRHFRTIFLWPLQLMPMKEGVQTQKHWEPLTGMDGAGPWRELEDEFTGDPAAFQERHYNEFVTFLPHVQRFLYGEGDASTMQSPIRVFRRSDVARARVTLGGAPPREILLDIAHVDLYFFFDIDIAILVVEAYADDLALRDAQDILFRFGRAYPAYWDAEGGGGHCPTKVQWLAADGAVLAESDYELRQKYLEHVCRHRAPCLASHWEFLLRPLAFAFGGAGGRIRCRQVEYHRMPLMAYLALDEPQALSRADFVRLTFAAEPGPSDRLPHSAAYLRRFERSHCIDRFWDSAGGGTRYLCCGHALVVVTGAAVANCRDPASGLLSQFRHQQFVSFLIAHFHKAALLAFSDRLVVALNRLDIQAPETVKRFKRAIRQAHETFLRFTHRYWFHDIADQALVKDLFRLSSDFLATDRLFVEVREEIQDMSQYLDSDSLRRQANTVIRLTVVTTFGLIATVTTGFLGMNLLAAADESALVKLAYLVLVSVPTAALVFFAVAKSRRLSDFLEALADERLNGRQKLSALKRVWQDEPAPPSGGGRRA